MKKCFNYNIHGCKEINVDRCYKGQDLFKLRTVQPSMIISAFPAMRAKELIISSAVSIAKNARSDECACLILELRSSTLFSLLEFGFEQTILIST